MLDAAVHLADDLHRLARLVVEGEEKDRRIHHALGLFMESAEQLPEVASAGGERAEPAHKLESHAKLRLTCTQRIKGGSACLDAQGGSPPKLGTNRERAHFPLSLST